MKKNSILILIFVLAASFVQSQVLEVGPLVYVDSTRLVQDSILVYYGNGVEIGRDTIPTGTGGGGGSTDYVSNVTTDGDSIYFTGVGNGFDGNIPFWNIYTQNDTFTTNRIALIKPGNTFEIMGNLGATGNRSRLFLNNTLVLLNVQNAGNTSQVGASQSITNMEFFNGTNIASFSASSDRANVTTDSDGNYFRAIPGRVGILSNEPATADSVNYATVYVDNSNVDPQVHIVTDGVQDGTATNGQVLTLQDASTGRVEYANGGGGTDDQTAAEVDLSPALDVNNSGANETTVQASLNALRIYGTYKDDIEAAANSVPLNGFYQVATGSTCCTAGTIRKRIN